MKNMENPHIQQALLILGVDYVKPPRKTKIYGGIKTAQEQAQWSLSLQPGHGDNATTKYVPGYQAKITSASWLLAFFSLSEHMLCGNNTAVMHFLGVQWLKLSPNDIGSKRQCT